MRLYCYFVMLLCLCLNITHDKRLTAIERSVAWRSWALRGWLSVSVTSAALHLVLIASELITPASVKQCCQTSPAQPCLHSILCTPAGQMEASEVDGGCIQMAVKNVKLFS